MLIRLTAGTSILSAFEQILQTRKSRNPRSRQCWDRISTLIGILKPVECYKKIWYENKLQVLQLL